MQYFLGFKRSCFLVMTIFWMAVNEIFDNDMTKFTGLDLRLSDCMLYNVQ